MPCFHIICPYFVTILSKKCPVTTSAGKKYRLINLPLGGEKLPDKLAWINLQKKLPPFCPILVLPFVFGTCLILSTQNHHFSQKIY